MSQSHPTEHIEGVEIKEEIFQNSTHRIFKSIHLDHRKIIVLKISRGNSKPLMEEVQILNSLWSVSSIPRVIDYGYTNQKFYYTSDFYDDSLSTVLKRCGTLTLKSVLSLGITLLGIVQQLHGQQIIYGNFSPENVMITSGMDYENRIRLIGFGKARLIYSPHQPRSGQCALPYQPRIYHHGKVVEEKDELESLGYLLIKLRSGISQVYEGKLPWECETEGAMGLHKSQLYNSNQLLKDMPQEFKLYFLHLESLNVESKYGTLKHLLQSLLLKYCKTTQQSFIELSYLAPITEVSNDAPSFQDAFFVSGKLKFSSNLSSMPILTNTTDSDSSIDGKVKALQSCQTKFISSL